MITGKEDVCHNVLFRTLDNDNEFFERALPAMFDMMKQVFTEISKTEDQLVAYHDNEDSKA